jgi:hypothetical protein
MFTFCVRFITCTGIDTQEEAPWLVSPQTLVSEQRLGIKTTGYILTSVRDLLNLPWNRHSGTRDHSLISFYIGFSRWVSITQQVTSSLPLPPDLYTCPEVDT